MSAEPYVAPWRRARDSYHHYRDGIGTADEVISAFAAWVTELHKEINVLAEDLAILKSERPGTEPHPLDGPRTPCFATNPCSICGKPLWWYAFSDEGMHLICQEGHQ